MATIESTVGITSAVASSNDISCDATLRPTTFDEFTGQHEVKAKLRIFVDAAMQRRESLDHALIFGPPGLGKTTLAHIISNELKAPIKVTSGPVLERKGDVASILTNLEPKSVLFIDEIHRLLPAIEEILYPAMEEYKFDIMIGEGPSARSIRMDLPSFTLVGATTRAGLLTAPLYDRFGIVERLEYYQVEDLKEIVLRSAARMKIDIDLGGAREVARRSRGTPRIANRLLRRVRDYAQVRADGRIHTEIADAALTMFNVDKEGLDTMDTHLLLAIMQKFNGGPVGLESLSAAIAEERGTIEDVVEPFLIQQGFLMRTPRGRVATPHAWKHLGLTKPRSDDGQQQLDV